MKTTLVKIEKNHFSDFLSEDDIRSLKDDKQASVFRIDGDFVAPADNELINLEISLRKCERVGVFDN